MILASQVNGIDAKMETRFGTVEISYEALAKMLALPDNCTIVSIFDRGDQNTFSIKIINENIKQLSEGVPITEILVGQGGWLGLGVGVNS